MFACIYCCFLYSLKLTSLLRSTRVTFQTSFKAHIRVDSWLKFLWKHFSIHYAWILDQRYTLKIFTSCWIKGGPTWMSCIIQPVTHLQKRAQGQSSNVHVQFSSGSRSYPPEPVCAKEGNLVQVGIVQCSRLWGRNKRRNAKRDASACACVRARAKKSGQKGLKHELAVLRYGEGEEPSRPVGGHHRRRTSASAPPSLVRTRRFEITHAARCIFGRADEWCSVLVSPGRALPAAPFRTIPQPGSKKTLPLLAFGVHSVHRRSSVKCAASSHNAQIASFTTFVEFRILSSALWSSARVVFRAIMGCLLCASLSFTSSTIV